MSRSILVFQATGAIGSALARSLAERGDRPVLVARDEARLAVLSAQLGGASFLAGDATVEATPRAALADFLLAPDAGWITGQVMAVNGGRSALRRAG